MKTICYCLTILLGVVLLAPANSEPTKITAKGIELVSGDGRHTLSLAPTDRGVGLWVRDNQRKTYAYIYSDPHIGPYLALGNENGVDPFAISLDPDGQPMVQIRVGDRTKHIDGRVLMDLLDKAGNK